MLVGDSIRLETREGNRIPNEQKPQRDSTSMADAEEYSKSNGAESTRSLSSVYNCFGMVFASRRTRVFPDSIEMILTDDGYTKLSSVESVIQGDLVLYTKDDEYSHVAVVVTPQFGEGGVGKRPLVMSQWGADGEYLHLWDHVNPSLGEPTEFWTDRYGI